MKIDKLLRKYNLILREIKSKPIWIYENRLGLMKEILNITIVLNSEHIDIDANIRELFDKTNFNSNYARALAKWILSGSTDLSELKNINSRVADYEFPMADNFNTYYGPRIKAQLPKLTELFFSNPNTRRLVINILQDKDKELYHDGSKLEYPCTQTLHFLFRENKMHLIVNMRSSNVETVLGYDLYIFRAIQKMFSRETKTEVGDLYINIASAHIIRKSHEDE